MPVCRCGRETRGFYFQQPVTRGKPEKPKHWCCSMRCLDAVHKELGMIDPTEHEIAAIEASSEPAGQYIESLGRTDMATWSRDEWMTFLECVVTGYVDHLQQVAGAEKALF